MTTLDASAETTETEEEAAPAAKKTARVNEKTSSGGTDQLAKAFNDAKEELDAKAAASKPGPKPGSKRAAPAEDDEDEKPAPKAKAKPEAESDGKAKKDTSYAKDADAQAKTEKKADEKGEDEAVAEKKPAKEEPKKPVEPKKYWSEKRKEAFRFQPREVQEQWVEEDPAPNDRWPTETKEAFAALPREAKEVVLAQLTEFERGVTQKFQSLAAERKLAEDIKAAVPAVMRQYMTQRGMNEPQVFSRLIALQQESMNDPAGYVRKFIASNNIKPSDIYQMEDGQSPTGQLQPQQQADIKSHPAFQALAAEYEQLRQSIDQDRQQRAQEEDRRFRTEFDGVMSETDGEGNSLYPYIRLLAEPMAQIIESDPEHFSSMGVKERFSTAYRLALQDFPELASPKRTAKTAPPPADERVEEPAAHAETEDKRAAALDKAITPKSKSMVTTPSAKGKIDSIDAAIASAKKQINANRRT